MEIKVKKLRPDAWLPTYATDGSGCFDIYALDAEGTWEVSDPLLGQPATFLTGLSFEIPQGYVMLVFSRSGHAFKNDVRLANCVGVIDSDYRGELKIKLAHDGGEFRDELLVKRYDRIAQAMIIPIPKVFFTEVEDLSKTDRGNGGFGSTGS